MEDNETKQIEEYLRLKKIEEEDKSDELIDEIYKKITKKEFSNETNEG